MNNKNIEEKAKEYALEIWKSAWESDEYSISTLESITEDAYVYGYTQAVSDQQDTLTQYKEALRELVKIAEYLANESSRIDKSFYALNQAKQLLNN